MLVSGADAGENTPTALVILLAMFIPEDMIRPLTFNMNFDGRMRLIQALVLSLMLGPVQMVVDCASTHHLVADRTSHDTPPSMNSTPQYGQRITRILGKTINIEALQVGQWMNHNQPP
jgi:hypothetical protein